LRIHSLSEGRPWEGAPVLGVTFIGAPVLGVTAYGLPSRTIFGTGRSPLSYLWARWHFGNIGIFVFWIFGILFFYFCILFYLKLYLNLFIFVLKLILIFN
jgi:hypothetical protein